MQTSTDLSLQVIEPTGILDSTQVEEFTSQVNSVLERGVKTLLIDLKDVTFVDSSGLGGLVVALKKARSAGCTMYLCSINAQVRMLFELTSMDQVFKVFSDRAAFEAQVLG